MISRREQPLKVTFLVTIHTKRYETGQEHIMIDRRVQPLKATLRVNHSHKTLRNRTRTHNDYRRVQPLMATLLVYHTQQNIGQVKKREEAAVEMEEKLYWDANYMWTTRTFPVTDAIVPRAPHTDGQNNDDDVTNENV